MSGDLIVMFYQVGIWVWVVIELVALVYVIYHPEKIISTVIVGMCCPVAIMLIPLFWSDLGRAGGLYATALFFGTGQSSWLAAPFALWGDYRGSS